MRKLLVALALVVSMVAVTIPQPAHAIPLVGNSCTNAGADASTGSICNNPNSKNGTDVARNIINTLLYILGIVAVIMIIVGGLRYVLSAGDKSALVSAKNTIMYAVIGLVIALLSFAIVNYVISQIK